MANKQIYELSNVGNNLDNSALVAVDIPNPDTSSASEIPYVTRKMSVAAMEQQVLNDEEYTTELNTENQTIFGSINEVLTYAKNIAEEYDDTATYAVGDFVTYMGVLYKCIVAIAVAESWDSTHWDSTLIVEEFGQGGGGASVTLGTTPPSDASGSDGDLYVQYDGTLYAAVYAYVKINGSWRKFPYNKTIALTQAEYEQITPETGVYYIITDKQSSYQTKEDSNLQTTSDTIVGAINELNTDKLDASKFGITRVELISPNLSESMYFFKQGNICIIECQTILAPNITIPVGGTLDLYTIQNQNNYPDTLKASTLFISGGLVGMVRFDNTTGKITLYNQSGSPIGANSAINFSLAYMAKIN